MRDAGRRPKGRLLYWYFAVVITAGFWLPAFGLPAAPQSGANTTTVSDTVYLADGTPAAGTLIITWPAFVTAEGTAVEQREAGIEWGTECRTGAEYRGDARRGLLHRGVSAGAGAG